MKNTILIADDDYLLRNLLKDILEDEYNLLEARDGQEALDLFFENPSINLVLLDIMMPKYSGIEVLKEIRERSEVPVLLLTALGDSKSEVEGLKLGAHDYISKPFHPEVLLARIEVLLRYKNKEMPKSLQMGMLELKGQTCQVFAEGKEVSLTNKEYQLLLYFMTNPNIVLSRDKILEKIWGFDYDGDIRTIDTHVKMLRMDLGKCGDYIKTVRGIGYLFSAEE